MSLLRSFCSAFLMYSRIPMPQVEWKEENRRYALCFFPLIGAVIGGVFMLWYYACGALDIGKILFSVVSAAIPVFVTGGIHLDGFCDVCDAKASFGSKEKMLEVMSDSRVGAFAVIKLVVYFFVQIGLFSEFKSVEVTEICALGFVQSRAWSGLAAVSFKSAKSSGTLQSFSNTAHRNITVLTEIVYLMVTSFLMLKISLTTGAAAVIGGIASFIYYRIFSYKKFGGITGDLAGYFLQICELCIMLFAAAAEVIL